MCPYIPSVLRVGFGGLFVEDTAAGGCTEGDGKSPGEKCHSEEMGREFLQAGAGTFVTTLCMYAFHICSVAVCGINAC